MSAGGGKGFRVRGATEYQALDRCNEFSWVCSVQDFSSRCEVAETVTRRDDAIVHC